MTTTKEQELKNRREWRDRIAKAALGFAINNSSAVRVAKSGNELIHKFTINDGVVDIEVTYANSTIFMVGFKPTNVIITITPHYRTGMKKKVFPQLKDGSFSWKKISARIAEIVAEYDSVERLRKERENVYNENEKRLQELLTEREYDALHRVGESFPSPVRENRYEIHFDSLTGEQVKQIAKILLKK